MTDGLDRKFRARVDNDGSVSDLQNGVQTHAILKHTKLEHQRKSQTQQRDYNCWHYPRCSPYWVHSFTLTHGCPPFPFAT